jgi:hypothetical protein
MVPLEINQIKNWTKFYPLTDHLLLYQIILQLCTVVAGYLAVKHDVARCETIDMYILLMCRYYGKKYICRVKPYDLNPSNSSHPSNFSFISSFSPP